MGRVLRATDQRLGETTGRHRAGRSSVRIDRLTLMKLGQVEVGMTIGQSGVPHGGHSCACTLVALAHFANEYHSGQWSRGYRLLCRTTRALARRGFSLVDSLDSPLTRHQRGIYDALVARHAERI